MHLIKNSFNVTRTLGLIIPEQELEDICEYFLKSNIKTDCNTECIERLTIIKAKVLCLFDSKNEGR